MNDMDFNGLTGEIITPFDPGYNKARQQWNRAVEKYPALVVYCINENDIKNAIKWSRQNAYAVRIRAGGHHYEGYSNGNGVVIIDLSLMNAISLNENLLTIEGGVRFKELYESLNESGCPFPGGSCPTVGVSGFTLGGGWGFSTRHLGMGCDSLKSLRLVDAEGNIVIADENQNADLLWACKGAGNGNFGVVTSMTYKLSPKPEQLSLIEFKYPSSDIKHQTEFIKVWQRWLKTAEDESTLMAKINRRNGGAVSIDCKGLYYGSLASARESLQPFVDFDKNISLSIHQRSFYEAMEQIEKAHPEYEMFKSTGRFVNEALSENDAERLVSVLNEIPPSSVYAALTLYAMGGKTAEKQSEDGAFFYRDASYIIGLQSVWTDEINADENTEWIDSRFPVLESMTAGSYVNFPYSKLRDPMKAYYGGNAEKLREIKKKYDPQNIFGHPQSIR